MVVFGCEHHVIRSCPPLLTSSTPSPQPEPERYRCLVHLPDWRLHMAHLTLAEGRDHGDVMDLAADGSAEMLRNALTNGGITEGSMLAQVRQGMADGNIDFSRALPVSESLVHQFHADGGVPRGTLAWDFLMLLIAKSQAPWSVLDPEELEPPLVFREGEPGESHHHADGEFNCSGLPVLADRNRVVATPWTHRRPDELEGCRSPLYICYLPRALFRKVQPRNHMGNAIWLTWVYKFIFERTCSFEG